MLAGIKQLASNFMGYIPFLKSVARRKTQDDAEQNKESPALKEEQRTEQSAYFQPSIEKKELITELDQLHKLKEGVEAIRPLIVARDRNILGDPENANFTNAIRDHIHKSFTDIHSPKINLEFLNNLISDQLNEHYIRNYINRLNVINEEAQNDPYEYLEHINDLIRESSKFIIEIGEEILAQAINQPNLSDLKLSEAFELNKAVSINIASRVVNALSSTLELLPEPEIIDPQSGHSVRAVILNELRSERFSTNIRSLYLASQYGMHSKPVIDSFMAAIQDFKRAGDREQYLPLKTLSNLHSAIHDSIQHDPYQPEWVGLQVGKIDSFIIDTALKELIDTAIAKFNLKHSVGVSRHDKDIRLEQLAHIDADLRDFLIRCGEIEGNNMTKANSMRNDTLLANIGLDLEKEADIIEKIYTDSSVDINHCINLLGDVNADTLNQIDVDEKHMINYLKTGESKRHFERLVYEVSLLAAVDAVSVMRGRKPKDDSFISFRQEPNRPNNFERMPWLESLYRDRYAFYEKQIQDDRTELGATSTAHQIADLAEELTDENEDRKNLFDNRDFCRRYGISDYMDKIENRMGDLTNMHVTSLMFDLYTNLFSHLAYEDTNLAPHKINMFRDLIRDFKYQSTIKDESGNPVYETQAITQYAPRTYDALFDYIGNPSRLHLNTRTVIDVFYDTMGISDTSQAFEKQVPKKNKALAAWVFFFMLKFLPEHSDDLKSLQARFEFFRTLIDERLPIKDGLTETFYKKLMLRSDGVDDDGKSPDKGKSGIVRNGVIKALGKELDEKITDCQNHRYCPIDLSDLLDLYKSVDDLIKANPNRVEKVMKFRRIAHSDNSRLIEGLDKALIKALDASPSLVVEFTKVKAPEHKDLIANELLNRTEKICSKIISSNNYQNGELVIKDSEKTIIKPLTKVLLQLNYLAYLLNDSNVNSTKIRANKFFTNNPNLEKILNAKVLLKLDENFTNDEEVFPGQLKVKNSLVHMLEKFNFETVFPGQNITWIDQSKENKLRARMAAHQELGQAA